ncbi:MAG: Uma2 family endonuclease [Phototrophicales bacterium]|nr:Uma2 family endonuclease [Phototrophicales bacterium]
MIKERLSVQAFEAYASEPENRERALEFINGEIYDMVCDWNSSEIGAEILGLLRTYIRKHKLGLITGADGGYRVNDERYIPDCAFVKQSRLIPNFTGSWYPIAPDLAVEVLSPTDSQREKKLRLKLQNYLIAGTIVWIIDPETQTIEVYSPNQIPRTYGMGESFLVGELLPNIQIKVDAIFVRD